MATGFIIGGVDIDTLYTAGSGGAATGFIKGASTDLSSLLLPYTTGTKVAASGFIFGGGGATNISDRFQNIAVPVFSGVNADYTDFWTGLGQNPSINFLSDGDVQGRGGVDKGNWGTPLTTGIGASYEIVTTHVSGTGTFTSGGIGTYALTSGQAFTISAAPAGQARERVFDYVIRGAGGGATLCSGRVTLTSDLA